MSSRKTVVMHIVTRASIGLGALFLVGVLLAAIPVHRAPVVAMIPAMPLQETQDPQDHSSMPDMMPGMNMSDTQSNESAAVHDMEHMHHGDSGHMHMATLRTQNPTDQQRAQEIVEQLKAGIEKYKDYRVALNDGFKIFHPELPQPEYHFTNYSNGFLEAFNFDPARPTSLLYKKTATGYELVGAMYTMPKRASEEQLNERVPLSVATWHLHTNVCVAPKAQQSHPDITKFGLRGSIVTADACDAAGGIFHPVVFGWMTHIYPYETSMDKIFAMHHHD